MNDTTFTEPIDFDLSKEFIYCGLEYSHYIAGDRVTGEIFLNLTESLKPSTLNISSKGVESLFVTKPTKQELSYSNDIFLMNTVLTAWEAVTPKGQYNFPFTFKLPYYAPATFNFRNHDNEGNLLEAKISYELSISLIVDDSIFLSDTLPIAIYNNKARSSPPQSEIITNLTTCCCTRRGYSYVLLRQPSADHPRYGETANFVLDIDWKNFDGEIAEVQGTIFHKLQLQLPGDKTYDFSSKLLHYRPTFSFLENLGSMKCSCELDLLLQGESGMNISSNSSAMINSEYIAEAVVVYNLGLTRKISEVSIPVHVNPRNCECRIYAIPAEWEPVSRSMHNVMLRCKRGELIYSPERASFGVSK